MITVVSLNSAMDRTVMVDQLRPGAEQRALSAAVHLGGKGLNVAQVVRALGESVCVTGFAGGPTGEYIRSECRRLGVADHLVRTAGESRVCYIFAEKNGSAPTVVNEPGPTVSAGEVAALVDLYDHLLPQASVVVLSGSMPPGVPADLYRTLIERARRAGRRCVLDASGTALREGLAGGPWVIKPNQGELAQLTGGPWDGVDAWKVRCAKLAALGAGNVVATLGAEGALVCSAGQFWRVTPPTVQAANPVGSGDALVAGMAVAAHRGQPLLEGVCLGTACAAANAASMTPYVPAGDELRMLMRGVTLSSC